MTEETSLEGKEFYVHAWQSTMTSRHTYEPKLMIVIADIGDTCIITEIQNGKLSPFHKEWSKENVEKQLKCFPCL